jgi:hypothetical protein
MRGPERLPVRLVIAKEYVEALKDSSGKETEKSILAFQGTDRELILNVTNWDAITTITRDADSAKWPGVEIELYPTTTPMGGKIVDCIRVRAPSKFGQTPGVKLPPVKPSPTSDARPLPPTEAYADAMDDGEQVPF